MALAVALDPGRQGLDLGGPPQLVDLVPGGRLGLERVVWTDHDKHVQADEDQEGAEQVREVEEANGAQCCRIPCRRGIYVINGIQDSKHCVAAIFASDPEPALSQPGDGRWLAVLLPRRNAIPRKRESCSPETADHHLLQGSLLFICALPSPPIVLFSSLHSYLPSFIMFKLARGRPIAAAFRAATVRYSRCRVIGPCPVTVDIVLIHHLGVIRLVQTGPAAEAEPVHSRVPVCPPPQIGMSNRAPIPRWLAQLFWTGAGR